ncbi:MAG TPA: (2Fe-2S)-binding protein, partial [Candidatus Thermoplasmatota archaeon]
VGLTGTKRGCDMGTCGCCTVLVDGENRLSCLTLAAQVAGKDIATIESLGSPSALHPLQRAFSDIGGSQCGFCTPGFIMTSKALLDRHPHPSDHEIKEAISGNLCRCTGYIKIVDAIKTAAKELTPEPSQPQATVPARRSH